jgi:serine O-acetyltransferase
LLRSSSVPPQVTIGRGTNFAYGGIAVVIHRRVIIGPGVTIGQNVTLGAKESRSGARANGGAPTIDEGSFIGPGAMIIGPVRIGAFSVVGANAVVTRDLEPGSVVGVSQTRDFKTLDEDNLIQYRSVFTSLRSLSDAQLLDRFRVAVRSHADEM